MLKINVTTTTVPESVRQINQTSLIRFDSERTQDLFKMFMNKKFGKSWNIQKFLSGFYKVDLKGDFENGTV